MARDRGYTDEPRRRRDDDDDEPRRRRDDDYDYDEDYDVRRSRKLTGMDAMFADTNIVLLVLFPLCCGVIALIFGIIGLATCKDETARQRALMVTIISAVWIVLAGGIRVAGIAMQP
jgi:hypothetical protein